MLEVKPFSVSCKASLMVTNCLSFFVCLFWKEFIFLSFLQDNLPCIVFLVDSFHLWSGEVVVYVLSRWYHWLDFLIGLWAWLSSCSWLCGISGHDLSLDVATGWTLFRWGSRQSFVVRQGLELCSTIRWEHRLCPDVGQDYRLGFLIRQAVLLLGKVTGQALWLGGTSAVFYSWVELETVFHILWGEDYFPASFVGGKNL